ncbi:MAG TPA: EthD family reductase [Marmoricola sp.]|nr:EthD family reductase [Marmoricola sp.]
MHRVTVQYATPADAEAFEQRYRDEHVPLVRTLPGLRRFSLSHPRGMQGEAPYLVAELWFDDGEAVKSALKSPEMARAGEHAAGLGAQLTIFTGEVDELDV